MTWTYAATHACVSALCQGRRPDAEKLVNDEEGANASVVASCVRRSVIPKESFISISSIRVDASYFVVCGCKVFYFD